MKIFYVLALCLSCLISSYSQNQNQAAEGFRNYDVFSSASVLISESVRAIAPDVEPYNVDESVLQKIQNDQPEFMQFTLVHGGETLNVKLQRVELFAPDFIIRNQNDDIINYTPGLYYRGKVNDERESLAVFNFFSENVNGVISIGGQGNRNIGQLQGSNQYVVYTDSKTTDSPDFTCDADQLENQNELIPQFNTTSESAFTSNCVGVFYELTFDVYQQNSSSIPASVNWLTSVHNIVATLYDDANIPISLSDVLVWDAADPYTGSNLDKLEFFNENRVAFNGDMAHLIDVPATGGVAYVDSLCGLFNHAFSGASISFQQLPAYSWTVNVVAHEMGHSLGSPHTHACFWNGNNTAIDICGPDSGNSEGCNSGPIPVNGGTIMSYCHLLNDVGVNLSLGFHPQVATHLDNSVDTKPCIDSNCNSTCYKTIANLITSQIAPGSLTVDIEDVVSDAWDYRIFEQNTLLPAPWTPTTNSTLNFNTIQPNTYYKIQVRNICDDGNFGGVFSMNYLSDDDWCSGITFTDNGGLNGNYSNKQEFTKTFYPTTPGENIVLNINQFDLEDGVDFMNIYDGENKGAPLFTEGINLTGSSLTTNFFQATNSSGAITVDFDANASISNSGWDITVSCMTLSNEEFTKADFIIYPNPTENELTIKSDITVDEILIYDLNGKVVYQKLIGQNLDERVSLNQLTSGIYFVRLINGNASVVKRIIKK